MTHQVTVDDAMGQTEDEQFLLSLLGEDTKSGARTSGGTPAVVHEEQCAPSKSGETDGRTHCMTAASFSDLYRLPIGTTEAEVVVQDLYLKSETYWIEPPEESSLTTSYARGVIFSFAPYNHPTQKLSTQQRMDFIHPRFRLGIGPAFSGTATLRPEARERGQKSSASTASVVVDIYAMIEP